MKIGDLLEVKLTYSENDSEHSLWNVYDCKNEKGDVLSRIYCNPKFRPAQANLLLELAAEEYE